MDGGCRKSGEQAREISHLVGQMTTKVDILRAEMIRDYVTGKISLAELVAFAKQKAYV